MLCFINNLSTVDVLHHTFQYEEVPSMFLNDTFLSSSAL